MSDRRMTPRAMAAAADALPQYLERPRAAAETYGTLRHVTDANGAYWIIEGEPQLAIMAKRLFPGSEGRGQGIAKFPANRRSFADLVWLQHRFPLKVADQAAWDAAYAQACGHVAALREMAKAPRHIRPDARFTGTLPPYQQEGVGWQRTYRRTLVADEVGLGKTVQALAFLADAGTWPALIVPPPHLRRHWIEKSVQFLGVEAASLAADRRGRDGERAPGLPPRLHVLRGRLPASTDDIPEAEIYLCHYLLLGAWREHLKAAGIRSIVFDEIQELRHAATEKYSAASDLAAGADNVIGLSGTPIFNRAGEIWAVTNILDYHCLGDWDSFTREWCLGYGSDIVRDPPRLGAYLKREGLMIRRRQEDVMQDLPAKRRVVENIDAHEGIYNEFIQEALARVRRAAGEKDPLARGRLEREAVAYARMATGLAKVPSVAAFLRGLMEAEEPTLCFVHHHQVTDELTKLLLPFKPVKFDGREDDEGKARSKAAFENGDTNLMFLSLRAAAGIDGLQARGRIVVFAELDWSPAVHTQGEGRLHRRGQRNAILAYYLVSRFGTDPDMQEALGLKISQFIGLMGDKAETEQDRVAAQDATRRHMRAIIARLRAEAGIGGGPIIVPPPDALHRFDGAFNA
jgi:hypothetical protein